jgi:hypothetical protein
LLFWAPFFGGFFFQEGWRGDDWAEKRARIFQSFFESFKKMFFFNEKKIMIFHFENYLNFPAIFLADF